MNRTLLAAACALVALSAFPAVAGDQLFYYVDNGNVVITNTPSRKDVKPVFLFEPGKSKWYGGTLPKTKYDPYIEQVARENGLDPNLIKAVALVESGFNPKAVSNKGARGIMQFIPSTAKEYGVTNLHDPYQSLRAGAQHLRALLDEFDGNLTLALAAYNAGSGAVRRYGGVPAYPETQDYVKKVKARMGKGTRRTGAGYNAPEAGKIVKKTNPDGSVSFYN